MNYSKFFSKLLLEESMPLPKPTIHDVPADAAATLFNPETNTDELDTRGIKDVIEKIESVFNRKMSLLDNVDQLPPDEINLRLDELDEYIENLEPYIKSKDMDITDPYSVMANIIQNNPRKKSAFEKTIAAIDDYRETSRKNQELVASAAKELQSKVGQLLKSRSSQDTPQHAPEDTTPQF